MTNQLLLSLLLATVATPALPQAATAPKGPQPVSRVVYMSRIDQGFGVIDANKDGYASKAEIEAAENKAIDARQARLQKQREAAFRNMDKDKNGSVSIQEFNAAMAARPERRADGSARLARLDTNKDGRVSMVENRAPASSRFEQLDTNKDGILSVEEQSKARRR